MDQLKNTMAQLPPILDFNSNTNKGMLFDVRDGQSYKVVRIGKQIWLAENFRYLPSKEKGDTYCNSWVYNNDNSYLDLHYGRLYDWNTAKNIAPEGWKLPSDKDFIELRDFIIKDNNLNAENKEVGSYLKSVNGWDDQIEPNNDKYGFNVKPVGFRHHMRRFCRSHTESILYSSTEGYAFRINTSSEDNFIEGDLHLSYYGKIFGFSVRLIKETLKN
jgi:uncharacterized protein (TIGR02145 family)